MAFGRRDTADNLFNDFAGDFTPHIGMARLSRRKSRRKAKKSRSTRRHSSRKRKNTRRVAHGRRSGKTYYTKNGQPYIKLASGKCRFIKGRRKK